MLTLALPAALPDRPRAIPPELLDAPRTLFTPHLGNPQRSNYLLRKAVSSRPNRGVGTIGSAVVEVRKAIERSAATTIVEWARGERPSNALNSV